MSAFGKHGRRCDYCGKFTNNKMGEYTKPDGKTCGYIRQPGWMFADDGSLIAGNEDCDFDICEECDADHCPHCGSDQIVKETPATPGPDGWGGRCKVCHKTWAMTSPAPRVASLTPAQNTETP